MKILLNNNDLNRALHTVSNLGFMPTMGSLHNGHESLIRRSLKECKNTIVSIFINPTQFNNINDYKKYPRNIKKDLSVLKKMKVDFVYIPNKKHIYNSIKKSNIKISLKEKILCAKYRKGHFEGVLDVMDRLTNIIKPKKIFMGKKDFQQLFLVKNYIEKKYETKVIGCKTIRDKNKLALSSRNYLLNNDSLNIAIKITKILFSIKKKIKKEDNINKFLSKIIKNLEKEFKIKIEYLEHRYELNLKLSNKPYKSKIFLSYYLNGVRLIDNI